MRFFSEIKELFHQDNIFISERMDYVETSFAITFHMLPAVSTFRTIFTLVPARDSLTIKLKTESEDLIIITNKPSDYHKLSEKISYLDLEADDNIDVTIQINKSISSGVFSIYDFSSFITDLLQRSDFEILSWFAAKLKNQDNVKFELFDCNISFSTRTLVFESSDNYVFQPKICRQQRLIMCKDSASFYNMDILELIPDDFIIEGIVRVDEDIKQRFNKLATVLSLIYIATSASINEDYLNVQINGQRILNRNIALSDVEADEKWQNIYSWIYTDGNPTDKALIARNLISLHCKYEPILHIDEMVFEAIKTNYNLYLRENVSQYINLKRDIAKYIQDVVAHLGNYALEIFEKFKGNLIALCVFLFTVVLTGIGDEQNWNKVFTPHTIYIIEIFVFGSFVYLIVCYKEICFKLDRTKHGYDELKDNYKDLLSSIEISQAFNEDKLWKETEQLVKLNIKLWSLVWGILLVCIIIIIELFTDNQGLLLWLWNKIVGIKL